MRKIFFICLTLISLQISAQDYISSSAYKRPQNKKEQKRHRIDSLMKQEEEGIINYRKQTDVGVKLLSDGYSIFMDIGRAQSIKKSLLYQIEIGERKSAREAKQSNPYDGAASPFIFGKENFFYYTKLGVQKQFLLANKGNKNGVNITCNVGGGFTLAVLRPYEYEVPDANGNTKFVQFSTLLSDPTIKGIRGGPSIAQGWEDLSATPGLYAKAALRFDYGHYTKTVTALEIGLSTEYYSKKITQVYDTPAKQSFISVYAAIIFGARKK